MKKAMGLAVAAMALGCVCGVAWGANVAVSRFWHNHQPIYWPDWSASQPNRVQFAKDSIDAKAGGAAHPDNNLTDIFGHNDRVNAYQSGPRNSLAAAHEDAGYAISYSGSLMENVRSLGNAGALGYGGDWFAGNREAMGWRTGGGGPRLDMVGFTYHHALAPVLPKSVFRKELQTFKQAWWKAWGKNMDLSDHSKGFFPTEMAFTTEMVDVLADEGYEWVIVASHHLSRTCPTYLQQGAADANYGINSSEPNRADLLGPSPESGWWYASPNPGNAAWNVSPFAYQLHKVQYVNPETGATKQMVAVPSDDVLSYKAGYSGAEIGMAQNIAAGATDSLRPVIILPATDGDNAWGGGASSWNESWPAFTRAAVGQGWDNVSIQEFVDRHGANAGVAHVEDGAWIFPEMCYGSPYFLKWVDPPCDAAHPERCYPGTQVDLETPGFALKFWNWAPVIAGANWCETAEQILEAQGTPVEEWKIATPYEWGDGSYNNLNVAEKAWHIYLAGLDSGFNYYGGKGNDDECKQSLANANAVGVLREFMAANLAQDRTAPSMMRPQRFPYNPGAHTFGWFNTTRTDGNFRKQMGSDFYVWTHVYDVSGIPDGGVTLWVRADKDGTNSLASTQNETYAGGPEVGEWMAFPMTRRTLPKTREELNAAASDGDIDYEFEPAEIADYYFAKVGCFRGQLVDYYVEARDATGNVAKSDIQHVWVEDDGTPAGGGTAASASFEPAAPSDCGDIAVTFRAGDGVLSGAAAVRCAYTFAGGDAEWHDVAMAPTGESGVWRVTFTAGSGAFTNDAPSLQVCFNDGGTNWESRGGANWRVAIRDCDAPVDGVKLEPNPAVAGEVATVSYYPAGRALEGAANVCVHHGYNGGNWTVAPGDAMAQVGDHWTFAFTVPAAASNLSMCFNDGGTLWDNNGSRDWTFAVTGTVEPPGPPEPPMPTNETFLALSMPMGGTAVVDGDWAEFELQGTSAQVQGALGWTNPLAGASGTAVPAANGDWSACVPLAEGTNVVRVSGMAAGGGTVASDSADGYEGFADGATGGTGFGAWMIGGAGADAGVFLAGEGTDNCAIGTPAWGFWAQDGACVEGIRPFAQPMAVGDTFAVRWENGAIESGYGVGIALQSTTGDTLWQLYFNGGDATYRMNADETATGWTDGGMDVALTWTGGRDFSATIAPLGGTPETVAGEFTGSGAPERFRIWNYSSVGGDEHNVYLRSIALTNASAGEELSVVATIVKTGEPFVVDALEWLAGEAPAVRLATAVPGIRYALERCDDLLADPQVWTSVDGSETVAGTDGVAFSLPAETAPFAAYRVVRQP